MSELSSKPGRGQGLESLLPDPLCSLVEDLTFQVTDPILTAMRVGIGPGQEDGTLVREALSTIQGLLLGSLCCGQHVVKTRDRVRAGYV